MSDDLGSDFAHDTSPTTASEKSLPEGTQPTDNHTQEEFNVFTQRKSDAGDFDKEHEKVSEENDNNRTVTSSEGLLEKDQMTSIVKNGEKSEIVSGHLTELSSVHSADHQKAEVVLASSEDSDSKALFNTNREFLDNSSLIEQNEVESIEYLNNSEIKITKKEEKQFDKIDEKIDKNNYIRLFETVNQNKETSNIIENANDYGHRWHHISTLTSLRRWESDPAIEREADEPLEEQRFPLVYRLSLRFSKVFLRNVEKIHLDSSYEKAGFLQKLSGRGFPYLNQWKRRYCVLTKGRLYLYEKELIKPSSDKCTSVIDLKYFDHVAEAMQKDSKKVSNVFVVTSQDRSFFDPGRHLFAADTLTEMHDWIAKLRESIELIRNNNRPNKGVKTQQSKRDSQGLPTEENPQQKQNQETDVAIATQDVVDAKVFESHEKLRNKQESAPSLKKKLKIESPDVNGDEETSDIEILKENDEKNTSSTNILSAKKISSTTISLQNPNLILDTKPQLESITKHRIRGPAGRRAPQLRRTIIMKERASSMSALQQEGLTDSDARQNENPEEMQNVPAEMDFNAIELAPLNSSQPVLAYHYSSDEDSHSGTECHGSDRVIKQSSSTGKKKQKFSKISFNLEDEYRHRNDMKMMPKNHIPFSSSKLSSEYPDSVSEDILDFRSLPRSLARESNRKKGNVLNKGLQGTALSGSASSEGRLSMGRASPEMDALDNLLMNRSVQTNLSLNQDGCLSDQEGSETSTFKGVQEEQLNKNEELLNEAEELKKALGRFSSTMQHLQHHTAELENRTKQIEHEFKVSKNDIIHLQETTEVIRSEVKKMSDMVNTITQEASKVKKDHVLQRQENEKIQRDASDALSQARKSQKEFEKLKCEYDLSLKDLQSLIASIRSSFDMPSEDRKHTKTTLSEVGKSHSENNSNYNKAVLCKDLKVEDNRDQNPNEDKKGNKDGTINQKGGYQSFFQRPTSLIYGLTSKAYNKSSNSKKEKEDKSPSHVKVDKEEKKKQKEDKQSSKHNERKNKQTKKHEQQKCTAESEIKPKSKEDKHFEKLDHHERKNYPGFSIENLPMMDDQTDSLERKSDRTRSGSPYVSHTSQNFGLEKSLSSPTVLAKFSNSKLNRPQELRIPPTSKEYYKSTSNNSSPDSPTSPSITTLPFQPSCQISPRESRVITETLFPNHPSNLQGMSRQYSEEKLVNRHRQGVFAITRQRSSPNIPVQRQSSGSLYPLQRQNSLGTVPEEGQLPRQASLMSVPENRPIVDQTLPLSPASSMVSFGLSLSPSGDRLDRYSARNSMELVTGPVLSGSLIQESQARNLPPSSEFHINDFALATSSIKKSSTKMITTETLIL